MPIIIKSFRQILKHRKGKDCKPHSKRVCYRCGKSGPYIATFPYTGDSARVEDKKGKKRMEKNKFFHKKGSVAHVRMEWDSDEDAANIAVKKGLLFSNVSHKLLMANDSKKKVKPRETTEYTTSNDESNSSDDDDYLSLLFKDLSFEQIEKIIELVKTINEKDELLESQEDLLIRENEKFVKLKEPSAHEVEKLD
jgi:hypothetical protein